ncbi:multiple epidermal growth factor-like domains 10 [Elysia marginata]|uniref:Multiple epidermal growth factor-like domains 10 n=1 Tax=Elysia marginata TaxID=1093978 RepID=A0AAV4JGV8_9GAST|nr:multiple epidermal growth factor-like domains 10 [Elysia marginata]
MGMAVRRNAVNIVLDRITPVIMSVVLVTWDVILVCARGKYGVNCSNACSVHCGGHDNSCHHVNGSCDLGCEVGYLPPWCKDKCPRGQFGSECAETCSVHCAGPADQCDFKTGKCYAGCELGYMPPTCHDECPTGTYGRDCKMTCSVNCAGREHDCDSATGSCDHGCESGYQGSFCSELCPRGRYGPTCSVQCAGKHRPCHHIDGSCYLGCVHDDQSTICRKDSGELNQNTWAIAATVVAVVVVAGAAAIVIGLLVRRLHKTYRNKSQTRSNNAAGREIELQPRCNVAVAIRERQDEQETSINRRSVQGHETAKINTQYLHLYDEAGDHYESPADIMQELEAYEIPISPTVTAKTGSLVQDGNKKEPKCHVDIDQACGAYEIPMPQAVYVKPDPPTGSQNQTEPTSKPFESTKTCGDGLTYTLSVVMQY